MKLELKHLAPYLPYGLKIRSGNDTYVMVSNSVDYEGDGFVSIDWIKGKTKKPILIPLSDLTKEDANNYNYVDENHLERSLLCGHAPFNVWLEFVKDHFDVFGLIEKGLAYKK